MDGAYSIIAQRSDDVMLKFNFLSLLLLILITITTSCYPPEAPAREETTTVIQPQEGWAIHRAPFFVLQHPNGWRVEDTGTGQYVALYPPTENPRQKIEIAYLGKEIGKEESLLTWYQAYLRAARGEPLPEIQVLRDEASPQPDGTQRRVLHTALTTELGPSQAIHITHGRLVLSIVTYTHDQTTTEVLKQIAGSIEFAPDAPTTLEELIAAQR